MSVQKMKDGRWRVNWRDPRRGPVADYFPRGEAGHADAIERDHQIKLAKARSRNRANISDGPTFRELAQDYIDVRGMELSDKTRSEILRTAAVYALPVMGNLPITRVSIAHWSEIEKRMIARRLTAPTINKYFQYLGNIFAWAVERDYLRDNPWSRRKPLRSKKRFRVELITPGELQRILEAADDHLRWALEVELNTGCRPGPSELFALKWDDFNQETGAVRIYAPKTDTYHTQYVSRAFLARLRERRELMRLQAERRAKRSGRIVPECPCVISFQGAPVLRLDSAWEKAKEKAGIDRRIRLYDVRHFYITYALAGGADLLDLAHRVGHRDANMIVNVYAHLVEQMRSKAPLKMPEIQFPAFSVPKMSTKNVDQSAEGRQSMAANKVITLDFIGRGGRI